MRRAAIAVMLLTAGALPAACSRQPATEDLQDRISELESENASLKEQVDQAQDRVASENEAAQARQAAAAAAAQRQDEGDEDRRYPDEDAANGGDAADQAARHAADAANEAAAAASDD